MRPPGRLAERQLLGDPGLWLGVVGLWEIIEAFLRAPVRVLFKSIENKFLRLTVGLGFAVYPELSEKCI